MGIVSNVPNVLGMTDYLLSTCELHGALLRLASSGHHSTFVDNLTLQCDYFDVHTNLTSTRDVLGNDCVFQSRVESIFVFLVPHLDKIKKSLSTLGRMEWHICLLTPAFHLISTQERLWG